MPLRRSIGDDNVIYRWNANSNQATRWLELDSYAVDHDWMPFSKGASELLAVGFADGSIKLINKNGKVDKHITTDTHKKSVIALRWSYDGGALATTGQDGSLKIWSKNGNLRTNLVSSDKPIYSVAWSPESDALLYAFDKFIALKPISANQQKNLQWKAHEGLVLKVDWSPNNNSILSCGEDCRYKVWDNYGIELSIKAACFTPLRPTTTWSTRLGGVLTVTTSQWVRLACSRYAIKQGGLTHSASCKTGQWRS
jgi:intraflagellar transport protein 80